MPRPLVLASASPRRQELLRQIGVRFELQPQDIDESLRAGELPADYASRLAAEKAAAALLRLPESAGRVVLGADTVVVCAGEILAKPVSAADAAAMLRRLSGTRHEVLTAVAVADSSRQEQAVSRSVVSFREIDPAEAENYWRTGEPRGKAGGYAIQGLAAVFIQHLEGSYSGVMGLPLYETAQLLGRFGIACWQIEGDSGNE